uniref:hypothetical protein n=1 Tax=Pseudonocardia sp. CA-138482 TaxID=3240023 RepID=UPI003F497206
MTAPYLAVVDWDARSVTVRFTWSTEHGRCQDCGLPAAYVNEIGDRLCSVDAAYQAAHGGSITYLFDEEDQPAEEQR